MQNIPTATNAQILSLLAGYPADLSIREPEEGEILEVCGDEPLQPLPDFWDICFREEAHETMVNEIMGAV